MSCGLMEVSVGANGVYMYLHVLGILRFFL